MRPFHYVNIIFLSVISLLIWLGYLYDLSAWWFVLTFITYSGLLVLGAIFIRWNFYFKSFDKGKNENWIALSFDDGPAKETAAILDILKEQNVQAAFFSIGKNAEANTELVKRWHEEGHIIGNHSYNHGFNFDWQSASKMADEIYRTNLTIKKITGKSPTFFRPPYGVTNPNLAKAVLKTEMYSIAWSVRSFDTSANDNKKLLQKILSQLKGGDIILLHDSMTITREILTELIVSARKNGFTFVRLDKMLDINAYA